MKGCSSCHAKMIVLILALFLAKGVYPGTVVINTDLNKINSTSSIADVFGNTLSRNFTDRNNFSWNYEISTFALLDVHAALFAHGSSVTVRGSRQLLIKSNVSLVINTTIDISAVSVLDKQIASHIGGYSVPKTNCCYVGAGPGAGVSFHGGGHGGSGGGSWRDTEYNISYGKPYIFFAQLLGGSTGTSVYDSDPGTGGGAIQIIVNGDLTIGSHGKILANGFTIANTSHRVCSGASSGGRILIEAKKVNLHGTLQASGGRGGWGFNLSHHCSDGGGGGVIHIKTNQMHRATSSSVSVDGGKGLQNGENGIFKVITTLNEGVIFVDTKACMITGSQIIQGNISDERAMIGCESLEYKICTFEFPGTLILGKNLTMVISGDNALRLVSQNGDIDVSTELKIGRESITGVTSKPRWLGGFFNYLDHDTGPGSDMHAAAHGNLTNPRSYGINPVLLIGGSSCTDRSLSIAVGGGAIALEAPNGTIFVNANITANAYAENTIKSCGASGGTIILKAKQVSLNAYVEANGCDGQYSGGDGGVISVTQADRGRIKVNPGKGRMVSHDNKKGKKGIIIDSGESPQFHARQTSCFSTTPTPSTAILTTHTSLFTSNAINTEISLAPSQSSIKLPAASTSIYVASKTSTQALIDSFQSTSSILHGVTISENSVLLSHDKSWSLNCTDSNLSTSELQISPTRSSPYQAVQSTSVFVAPKDTVSPAFKQFAGVVVNKQSTLNVSQQLADAVQNTSTMTANDTLIALELIVQMSSSSVFVPTDKQEGETVTRNILKSCGIIARSNHELESHDEKAREIVPRITETLENLGEGIGAILEKNETFLVQDETIAFEVTNIDTETPREMSFPVSTEAKQKIDNNVTIPKEIFASAPENVSVILIIMNINGTYNKSNSLNGSSVQTISNIISIRLSSGKLHSLKQPIVLRHRVPKQIPKNREIRGGYWQSRSKSSSQSGWSYEGCSSTKKGDSLETKSSHMTSFAVLMTVKKVPITEGHKKALLLITYIGCGISLFGLLLTFATFVTLDTLDQERTAIHCNLVVSLGIAQIIFLAGIQATENKAACTTVAVLLHYFFTAAFSWMFAEGVHLYKKVVSVFSHGSKLKFYYVIGWGLPVIIVALSAGIRPDGYGNQNACWISLSGGLIWAFVAPVIIVMIINLIVMIIVVKILMSSVSTVQVDSKTHQQMNRSTQQVKAGAKAMVILMPILGLSWVFGLLAVNESTIVFQYLFCIFNSFQGLFIFLVHCVGNSEVRSAFRRLHERHTLSKSIGERSMVVKSMDKRSRPGSSGDEILVRREAGSFVGSIDDERTVTPKTISAGQVSLNSLNCPMTNIDYQQETFA